MLYSILAKVPGVAGRIEKNRFWRKKVRLKNEFNFFLAYVNPRVPMCFLKQIQPIRSSRLPSYSLHIDIYTNIQILI